MKITGVEAISPEDIDNKILVVKVDRREVNPEAVHRELIKVFPNLLLHNMLIMPDDWTINSLPRQEVVARLRGILNRLGG